MSDAVVRLTFPAKADYLLLARLALSGVARNLRIEDEVFNGCGCHREYVW